MRVGGSDPCFCSSLARDASPTGPSTSTTKKWLVSPVGNPMFALGHLAHQPRIIGPTVVAFLNPCVPLNGLLPSRGKTAWPSAAYWRAAPKSGFSISCVLICEMTFPVAPAPELTAIDVVAFLVVIAPPFSRSDGALARTLDQAVR